MIEKLMAFRNELLVRYKLDPNANEHVKRAVQRYDAFIIGLQSRTHNDPVQVCSDIRAEKLKLHNVLAPLAA